MALKPRVLLSHCEQHVNQLITHLVLKFLHYLDHHSLRYIWGHISYAYVNSLCFNKLI